MNNFFYTSYRKSDALGRYYTDHRISNIIYDLVSRRKINKIIDLGCGVGNLSLPFINSNKEYECTLVDVDENIFEKFFLNKNIKYFNLNILDNNKSTLNIIANKYDLAICNPPYIETLWTDYLKEIIIKSKLDERIFKKTYAPVALLFLALNLLLIEDNGVLVIILPDQYISGLFYTSFRKSLIDNYSIEKIIKLPSNSFSNVLVDSYILEIRKNKNKQQVKLFEVDKDFNLKYISQVSKKILYNSFNINKINALNHKDKFPLSKFKILFRGNISSNMLNKFNFRIFHSTNCKDKHSNLSDFIYDNNILFNEQKVKYAVTGDIIICRIGRNFYKKIFYLEHGYIAVSDHFFILRVDKDLSKEVYRWLTNAGNERLQNIAQGSGVKFISLKTLKELCFSEFEFKVTE